MRAKKLFSYCYLFHPIWIRSIFMQREPWKRIFCIECKQQFSIEKFLVERASRFIMFENCMMTSHNFQGCKFWVVSSFKSFQMVFDALLVLNQKETSSVEASTQSKFMRARKWTKKMNECDTLEQFVFSLKRFEKNGKHAFSGVVELVKKNLETFILFLLGARL